MFNEHLYECSLFSLKDFTVFGGSLSGAHAKKICKVNLNKWKKNPITIQPITRQSYFITLLFTIM